MWTQLSLLQTVLESFEQRQGWRWAYQQGTLGDAHGVRCGHWLSALHEGVCIPGGLCPTHGVTALGERLGGGQRVLEVALQRYGLLIQPQRLLL